MKQPKNQRIDTALRIAYYIANRCIKKGKPIRKGNIFGLLYIIQVKSITQLNKIAFADELKAWTYSIGVSSVYFDMFRIMDSPISYIPQSYRIDKLYLDEDVVQLINEVIDEYAYMPSTKIKQLTCYKGSPYDIVRNEYLIHKRKTNTIDLDFLYLYSVNHKNTNNEKQEQEKPNETALYLAKKNSSNKQPDNAKYVMFAFPFSKTEDVCIEAFTTLNDAIEKAKSDKRLYKAVFEIYDNNEKLMCKII